MLRKILMLAAAVAVPVGAVSVTAVTAGAGTPLPPDPAVTCSVSQTVTFAPPGLSHAGAITTSKTSATTTSPSTFGGGCTGGAAPSTITTKNTKCDKHTAGLPATNPACTPGNLGYDSWANFTAAGTTSIQKSLKKLSFTINGITYGTKTTGVAEILPGGACGASEVGFQVVGTVKSPKNDKGQTATENACLGTITGTGLNPTDNFLAAVIDQVGTVATADVDPVTSTIHVG